MINIKNIKQSYSQGKSTIKVLDNLNLKICKGEKVGIVGPSGSGKTTLLNIIGLLEKPDSGSIEINQVDCVSMNLEQKTLFRRNYIGYIFQNNQLLEDFSVIENVAVPLILKNLSKKLSFKKASHLLEVLGILDKANFKPGTLSGGEQQRVAIARAVIKDPLILLADEPTGSLDEKNTDKISDIIISFVENIETSLILATHNYKLIKKLDKCYKVNEGCVSEFKYE